MDLILCNPVIEEILKEYSFDLGADSIKYRNHVYRVLNFSKLLTGNQFNVDLYSITAVFHDLGIWTDNTFNYIEPSVELAKTYCKTKGFNEAFCQKVTELIENHHKISHVTGNLDAEFFRKADLIDLSLGLIPFEIPKRYIMEVRKSFPNHGFHWKLTCLFFKNLFQHPFHPLPMYKK